MSESESIVNGSEGVPNVSEDGSGRWRRGNVNVTITEFDDRLRRAALFNDIGRAPVTKGRRSLFSDRRLLADYLWEQGWRRELRSEDYTS